MNLQNTKNTQIQELKKKILFLENELNNKNDEIEYQKSKKLKARKKRAITNKNLQNANKECLIYMRNINHLKQIIHKLSVKYKNKPIYKDIEKEFDSFLYPSEMLTCSICYDNIVKGTNEIRCSSHNCDVVLHEDCLLQSYDNDNRCCFCRNKYSKKIIEKINNLQTIYNKNYESD